MLTHIHAYGLFLQASSSLPPGVMLTIVAMVIIPRGGGIFTAHRLVMYELMLHLAL